MKILARYSIVGLLTATLFTSGCSEQEEIEKQQEEQQETSHLRSITSDEDPEKSKKPDGTEVQIRGKSG